MSDVVGNPEDRFSCDKAENEVVVFVHFILFAVPLIL